MKFNGFLLFLLLFLGVIVLTSIYYPLRYLKYLLPLAPLIMFNNNKRILIDKKILNYYSTFIIFYSIVILYFLIRNTFNVDFSPRFFPNIVFTLTPLLFIILIIPYFKIEKLKKYILTIFTINILVFFNVNFANLITVFSNLTVFKDAVLSSTINTENHLGYTFGILIIFFILEKYPKKYILIAFIFLIFCFKRIVLISVLICIPTYFIINFFRINIFKHRIFFSTLGIIANLVYIKITHLIVTGYFDKFILEKTGFSAERFSMGRKQFYTEAFNQAGPISWFGIGIGKIDDMIFNYYGSQMNLHSETLRNYFEYGFFIFIIWLFILYYKNLFSNKAAVLLVYFNLLMLTDNAFVYFDVLFYFYFFIFIFLYQKYNQPSLS